jgi:dual specificity tyrosine-phosphorylation-regulated kinase 2/3/4
MLEKQFKAKSLARIPKAPCSTKSISHMLKLSQVPAEQNENSSKQPSAPSHRHTRSYGRLPPVTPAGPSPVRTSGSPAITPCRALLHMHEQLSHFEYKEITNYKELYYLGSGRKTNEGNLDDRDGYYNIHPDDHILYRYQIIEELGQGTFGTVVKCRDHKSNDLVAIKILRKNARVKEYGKNEINFLNQLESDETTETCIVDKLTQFVFRDHLCIVFELLSINLYDFLKKNHFQGISTGLARRITTQVLIALKHSHSLGIVHCDIKPENIVFKQENKSGVKLIDFGSAWAKGERLSYIQSRFYRAPEVLIEANWDKSIDIWSLGCMVVEMITGWPIFVGDNEIDVFRNMVKIMGMPGREFFMQKRKYDKIDFKELEKEFGWTRGKCEIEQILFGQDPFMVDFVKCCLKWNREERISAEDGLAHTWIRGCH